MFFIKSPTDIRLDIGCQLAKGITTRTINQIAFDLVYNNLSAIVANYVTAKCINIFSGYKYVWNEIFYHFAYRLFTLFYLSFCLRITNYVVLLQQIVLITSLPFELNCVGNSVNTGLAFLLLTFDIKDMVDNIS